MKVIAAQVNCHWEEGGQGRGMVEPVTNSGADYVWSRAWMEFAPGNGWRFFLRGAVGRGRQFGAIARKRRLQGGGGLTSGR